MLVGLLLLGISIIGVGELAKLSSEYGLITVVMLIVVGTLAGMGFLIIRAGITELQDNRKERAQYIEYIKAVVAIIERNTSATEEITLVVRQVAQEMRDLRHHRTG